MLGMGLSLSFAAMRRGAAPVDTTAPTATVTAGAQQTDGSIDLTVADLTENGTLGIVLTTSDQSGATKEAVKAAAEGGTALTDQAAIQTQAVTVGGGPYAPSIPSGLDGSYYYQFVIWDAAGNISPVYSDGPDAIDTTAPSVSTLSPADGATDVAVGANLVLTFNESMKRQGTVTLKNVGGATIETFDLSTDGTWSTVSETDDRITLNPTSDFTNGASLAVQWSGLEDTKGNALANNATDTTWNFDVVASAAALVQFMDEYASNTFTQTPSFTVDLSALTAGYTIIVHYGITASSVSATLNGNSLGAAIVNSGGAIGGARSHVFQYTLPSDGTASDTLAFDVGVSSVDHRVAVWAISPDGVVDEAVIATYQDGSTTYPVNQSVTPTAANNAIIGTCIGNSSSTALNTWTNATEQYDIFDIALATGALAEDVAVSSYTVGFTPSTGNGERGSVAIISVSEGP